MTLALVDFTESPYQGPCQPFIASSSARVAVPLVKVGVSVILIQLPNGSNTRPPVAPVGHVAAETAPQLSCIMSSVAVVVVQVANVLVSNGTAPEGTVPVLSHA